MTVTARSTEHRGTEAPRHLLLGLAIAASVAYAQGLTAGSDRRPPAQLTNRLWFAETGANRIGVLSFP